MANPPWVPDGTQPPPPPTVWDDPMSGLVTGANYEEEPLRIDLVEPVELDMDEVRRQVDAVLAGEELPTAAPTIPGPRPSGEPPRTPPPNPRAGWPRIPSARQPVRIQRVRDPNASTVGRVAVVFAILAVIAILITIVIGIIAGVVNTVTQLFT